MRFVICWPSMGEKMREGGGGGCLQDAVHEWHWAFCAMQLNMWEKGI